MTTPTMSAECPECAGAVRTAPDLMAGELLPCHDCGAELEVVSLEPLALSLAPEVQEDWGE